MPRFTKVSFVTLLSQGSSCAPDNTDHRATHSDAGKEPGEDRFLCVDTVLRLVEHDRSRPLDHLVCDFETAVGGQAVHHDGILVLQGQQLLAELVRAEYL